MKANKVWPVVLGEDDDNDYLLLKTAWKRADVAHPLVRMNDGVILLEYLRESVVRSALVLLDVKMPRKNGHEVLLEMKADPALSTIPVVMLSASSHPSDIRHAYSSGAVSYLVKPGGLNETVALVRLIRDYWLEAVEAPDGEAP